MAKNLTKSSKQPMAMERNSKNMEAKVASGNLRGSAYEMPGMNNKERAMQKHMGGMPNRDMNGYT